MYTDIDNLYKKFIDIRKMGFVPSLRDGPTGIGYTFETLLGKKEDKLINPDFGSIEIKTMSIISRRKLHLFNATPDGDYAQPINRILNSLGYPDKQNPAFKSFHMDVNAKKYTWIGFYKKMRLYVNKYDKKVELFAYRENGNMIDLQTSWSFSLLEERLKTKLAYLAVVEAKKKYINGIQHYHYTKISFYKLRDFKRFIKLIKNGKIMVTFKISTIKTGERIGEIHDHGTDFSIYYKNINRLYKRIG